VELVHKENSGATVEELIRKALQRL
jgi:hypothetical protein